MTEQASDCGCPEGRVKNKAGRCVMPEVSFISLVLSLNTTALFHMGEMAHPESGEKVVDLELAKHSIDTLSMLAEKTRGNLDAQENELITKVLYELKMHFIQASGAGM
jgi:hypothetical protein